MCYFRHSRASARLTIGDEPGYLVTGGLTYVSKHGVATSPLAGCMCGAVSGLVHLQPKPTTQFPVLHLLGPGWGDPQSSTLTSGPALPKHRPHHHVPTPTHLHSHTPHTTHTHTRTGESLLICASCPEKSGGKSEIRLEHALKRFLSMKAPPGFWY